MKKFNFTLQKLLDIRVDLEEESKRHFVEAQRVKILAEEKLFNLKEEYKKSNIVRREDTILEKKLQNYYNNALLFSISEAAETLIEKSRIVDTKREDMKKRHIEAKTVELLKEKRLENYKKEIDDKEQKQNDEFALYSYIRNFAGK